MTGSGARPRIVSRQVLADHVYEEMLASLMDGGYAPGAPLSIDGVARDLEVSPTPVREALARLEATGLVHRIALKGYRVSPLFTTEELAELLDARLAIEPGNAAQACERVTPELLDALERSIADLQQAPKGPTFAEYRQYWQADERFHQLIAESAGNRFLLMAYNCLGGQVQRFRFFSGLGVTDAEFAIQEHTAVLTALRAGTPKKAQAAMAAHIRGVRSRAIKDVLDRGEWPSK